MILTLTSQSRMVSSLRVGIASMRSTSREKSCGHESRARVHVCVCACPCELTHAPAHDTFTAPPPPTLNTMAMSKFFRLKPTRSRLTTSMSSSDTA